MNTRAHGATEKLHLKSHETGVGRYVTEHREWNIRHGQKFDFTNYRSKKFIA